MSHPGRKGLKWARAQEAVCAADPRVRATAHTQLTPSVAASQQLPGAGCGEGGSCQSLLPPALQALPRWGWESWGADGMGRREDEHAQAREVQGRGDSSRTTGLAVTRLQERKHGRPRRRPEETG